MIFGATISNSFWYDAGQVLHCYQDNNGTPGDTNCTPETTISSFYTNNFGWNTSAWTFTGSGYPYLAWENPPLTLKTPNTNSSYYQSMIASITTAAQGIVQKLQQLLKGK